MHNDEENWIEFTGTHPPIVFEEGVEEQCIDTILKNINLLFAQRQKK